MVAALPDPDDARHWAENELSNPKYDEARATAFDRIALFIGETLGRLLNPQANFSWSPLIWVLLTAAVIVLVILAWRIWGRPRAVSTGTREPAALFDGDRRSAAELRRDADAAAQREDWDEAVANRFRAIARSLVERDIVDAPPGMTAATLATTASRAFPDADSEFRYAADAFDDVRYLRRHATRADDDRLRRLDLSVQNARPHADAAHLDGSTWAQSSAWSRSNPLERATDPPSGRSSS